MLTKIKRVLRRTTETKIGNTLYTIISVFSPDASETAEQKLLRLAAETALNISSESADNSRGIKAL
jgi:hypothetical protein